MQYTITLNQQDLQTLNAAFGEIPFKVSAPLIDKLNKQIADQIEVK
mgnify:CR=1 FL=1